MIEEIGIVSEVHGTSAKVRVQKRGTCDGCMASGVCESSENGMEIEAVNPVNAEKGQTVRVFIKPQVYLKGTIYVYGLPLAAFIAGVVLGKNIGEAYFSELNSDLVSAGTGFVLLALSFFIVRLWSKKAESKAEYKPVIEEIVTKTTIQGS
jgi:positive regulator of sigma E activity